ncbi:hypothetical protein Golob_027830 [Gossypium lobatum]|uniref:CCHC-type domain-containing protein n=1 Tax=Gossypium lobatum TaxID=34289 RepID=A0A7J8NDM0_9ROSI|nr:hypothetical protein [Gossypium lobatum]
MALPSCSSAVQSTTPVVASSFSDGVVDIRFFSTKRVSVLLENHEFARFEQQDSALASWLLSSVSTAVLPHLIGLDTSAQIWTAITLYGSKTMSRLIFYRRVLHYQKKGDLSMKDFLMKAKGYCDNLASCGEVISDHEHVTVILNGLSPEYESVITIVTASQVPYNVQGVTTILLNAKARQQMTVLETPSSTKLVSHQSQSLVVDNGSVPEYRCTIPARGRGRGRSYGSRVQCQLCGKPGHLVDRCYYRFDS